MTPSTTDPARLIAASAHAPSSTSRHDSTIHVEKVVYAPRNPIISGPRIPAGRTSRSMAQANSRPSAKLPLTLMSSVPNGNTPPARSVTARSTTRRATAPAKPPIPTRTSSIPSVVEGGDAQDVEPAVDVDHLAGDGGAEVRREVCRGPAAVLDRDVGAERGQLVERPVELAEARDAPRGQGPDGPRRDRVDPDPVRTEVGREVPDRRLERRLGHAHDVVVGHDLLGAVVAEGDDRRAPVEVGPGFASQRHERVGGHVERQREAVPGRVDERAVEVLALRVRDRVHEDVDLALLLVPLPEDRVDLLVLRDVARLDERGADALCERPDASLDEALDGGEADDRPLVVERLGDAPGDRVVVRVPEHERLARGEQTHPRSPPW